ncbi:MAG: thiol reductant ABC exporter subunit CydD [Actinomycetes bacterium]
MRPVDRRLQGHAPAARGHLVLAAGLAAGSAALLVVQAFAVTELVVRPFQQGAGVAALRTPLLVLGGVVLGRALLAWASEVSAHRASARVKSQLRHQLLEHVVRLGPAWLAQQRTGDLATLATRGTDALDGYFARYLPALVAAAIVPPAVLVVILTQDLLDGLIILVTLPLVPVFAMLVGLATQRRTRRRWRTLAALGGHFLDVVEGLPTLLVFRRAAAQVETIRRVTDENRRASMATLRLAFLSSAVLEFVATISVALVAVSTGLRMVGGTLDLHTGLVVLVLAPEAYWPLRQVGAQFHASADGLAAAEQVFTVLETPETRSRSTPTRRPPDLARATLRIEGLSVAHDRSRPALAPFDLVVAPGEYVGLTGPSGCGKSTLLGVLLGFVAPSSGRVTVDAPDCAGGPVDLAEIDLEAWRAQVAWVPQQPWLAAASIRDNVRLARPDADDAAVARAVELAHASAFVAALPQGLDTLLGDRGAGLSAGQRQRIALARAFLRDAPLVLLDEPTAHLDAGSERAVADAVRRLAVDRTVIAVAHRPALLADADRVVTIGPPAAPPHQLAMTDAVS